MKFNERVKRVAEAWINESEKEREDPMMGPYTFDDCTPEAQARFLRYAAAAIAASDATLAVTSDIVEDLADILVAELVNFGLIAEADHDNALRKTEIILRNHLPRALAALRGFNDK